MLEQTICLELLFRGTRDYLHSASIFDSVVTELEQFDSIEFFLYKKMTHVLSLIAIDTPFDKQDFSGLVYVTQQGKECIFGLQEDKSKPVIKREAYDESTIIKDASYEVSTHSMQLFPVENYTLIEQVVALNKWLVQKEVASDVKWAVTRIIFFKMPIKGVLRLQLIKKLGVRLIKTAIYIDDILYGYIYFSDFSTAYQ